MITCNQIHLALKMTNIISDLLKYLMTVTKVENCSWRVMTTLHKGGEKQDTLTPSIDMRL